MPASSFEVSCLVCVIVQDSKGELSGSLGHMWISRLGKQPLQGAKVSQKVFASCIGAAGARMFGCVLFVLAFPAKVKRRSCKETRESAQR